MQNKQNELIFRDISIFKEVLDQEVIDILKRNNFVVWLAPESVFEAFRRYKIANQGTEVPIPKEDYMRLMEVSANLQNKLEDIKQLPNAVEILQSIPPMEEMSIDTSVLTAMNADLEIKDTSTEKELDEYWNQKCITMVVRLTDLTGFKGMQEKKDEFLFIKNEQYLNLIIDSNKSKVLDEVLQGAM